MQITLRMLTLLVVLGMLAGCGARQIAGKLPGAQEQRLITHAVDDLIRALPAEDFEPRRGQRVLIETLAVSDGGAVKYAVARLETELAQTYSMQIVADKAQADFVLRVFFTALGTDHDKSGFSIPLVVLPNAEYTSDLNLLALDMYHGVAEMYYYIVSPQGEVLARRDPIMARERIDKISTPVFSFPINSVD